MIVLGLTGSIGMGKSTTAGLFAEEGAWVHDADRTVHDLYARGGEAVTGIAAAFPDAVAGEAVDREALAAALAKDPDGFSRVEAIVHPLVARSRDRFLSEAREAGAGVVVLDVPLLFETGGDDGLDAVVVVSAPPDVQRQRVLERPGMTAEKFEELAGRQVPDSEKRARADFVVDTSQGVEPTRAQVREILATVTHPGWRPRRDLAGPREASH